MLAIEARESRNAVSAALLMHGLLAAALLLSLQWKDRTPIVQAELWSAMPRDIPATFTPPAPAVRPAPPAPAAPVPETKADIALKKKEEPKKTEPKKEEPKKLEPPKADVLKAQQEAQKKAQEKKLAEKKAAEQLEAQRRAELARLGIDPNAKPGAAGKDATTKTGVVAGGAAIGEKTGTKADYSDKIGARIRNEIRFDPSRIPGNPRVDFVIEQLPTGEITKVTKMKSSGHPSWDTAVERAIWRASPLPKPETGQVARIFDYSASLDELR
jgi:colicin import membrane protein